MSQALHLRGTLMCSQNLRVAVHGMYDLEETIFLEDCPGRIYSTPDPQVTWGEGVGAHATWVSVVYNRLW